jgi:eukaryotic-like serine/threonine-protein kinase
MKSADVVAQDPGAPAASEAGATGPSRRLAPGCLLGDKYLLLGLLGEGGMGTVWRAHSVVLDVDVAIKVLRGDRIDRLASDRLLREAQATAALGHPAIVRVFEFGETPAGEPFLVMERLEGLSLAEWLAQRGRLSAEQAVQMLLPIADGLVAAHAHGIIHRDVKPANIIAVPDREGAYNPKIVDFGIAKMAKSGGQILTEYGTVMGSVEYMSPEQADGSVVGEQSDVWALCVTLYELITGRRPFEGRSAPAMLMALYTKTPVPTVQLAAGDADLWAILARGLEKSPADRWPTMRALGQALATWATQRGVTVDAAGASIEHVWLGRASGDGWLPAGPASAERPSPLALSVGATLPPPAMPRSDTLSSPVSPPDSHPSHESGARVPSRRARVKARVVACVFAALILAPVVGVIGLRFRGAGAAGAGEPRTMAAAAAPPGLAGTAAAMPSAPAGTPRAEVASPPAVVSAAAGASASPHHRPKPTSPTMPLPSVPGF